MLPVLIPVLPSADISRDIVWYEKYTGFKKTYADTHYALLQKGPLELHLQWHADTEDDPLLGGSVIRIQVEDVHLVFEDFLKRGTVTKDKLRLNTAWNTNEFGFYDLNKNAIFIMESATKSNNSKSNPA